jgi:hypothetical protein
MATKAQAYRARTERSGPKKEKAPKRPRRDTPVDTAQPGTSASDRKAGAGDTAARNRSKRAAKKGGAALESSRDKPSRKSTRRSKGRAKRSSNLKQRATRAASTPAARAAKASAKRGRRARS